MQNIFYKLLIQGIYKEIHKFYWTNKSFVYPNAIIITKDQLYSFYPQIKGKSRNFIKIESLCGLKVVFTDYIEKPRLIKL